jgi:hypothetical protein
MKSDVKDTVYVEGQQYTSRCKWQQCGQLFTWVYKGGKGRECCCQRHGLLIIVYHTLEEIKKLNGVASKLTIDQAADCIEQALQGYTNEDIAKLNNLKLEDVEYFLSAKSTRLRHRLDRRKEVDGELTNKTKKMIQVALQRGASIKEVAKLHYISIYMVKKIADEILPSVTYIPEPKPVEDIPVIKVISGTVISHVPLTTLFVKEDGSKFYITSVK